MACVLVNDDTVGAVRSMVIVAPVAAEAGPVLPAASAAALTARRGMTVPSEQPVIVTVRELPESASGPKAHDVAVPVFEKSPAATPVTASENVSVYDSDAAFVGDAVTAVNDETVYVGSYDKKLYALSAVTGGVRWTFDAGERIAGSPTVIGDLVWFSTIARIPRNGRTYALNARTGRKVFTFPDGRYTPATGIDGLLVLTGVRTLYGMKPTP